MGGLSVGGVIETAGCPRLWVPLLGGPLPRGLHLNPLPWLPQQGSLISLARFLSSLSKALPAPRLLLPGNPVAPSEGSPLIPCLDSPSKAPPFPHQGSPSAALLSGNCLPQRWDPSQMPGAGAGTHPLHPHVPPM